MHHYHSTVVLYKYTNYIKLCLDKARHAIKSLEKSRIHWSSGLEQPPVYQKSHKSTYSKQSSWPAADCSMGLHACTKCLNGLTARESALNRAHRHMVWDWMHFKIRSWKHNQHDKIKSVPLSDISQMAFLNEVHWYIVLINKQWNWHPLPKYTLECIGRNLWDHHIAQMSHSWATSRFSSYPQKGNAHS